MSLAVVRALAIWSEVIESWKTLLDEEPSVLFDGIAAICSVLAIDKFASKSPSMAVRNCNVPVRPRTVSNPQI